MSLTIKTLRKDLPHWKWKATKRGFGWTYEGSIKQDDRLVQVLVYPEAQWTGWEDEYTTRWLVEHGLHYEEYSAFFLKERNRT